MPWKDWAVPIISGVVALGVAALTVGEKFWSGVTTRREAREKADRDSRNTADIAQTQDLTARFRALLDGYETHIKGLSEELIETKGQLREAYKEIDRLREIHAR